MTDSRDVGGVVDDGACCVAWARLQWNVVHVDDVSKTLEAYAWRKVLAGAEREPRTQPSWAFVQDPAVDAAFAGSFIGHLQRQDPRAWAAFLAPDHEGHPRRFIEAVSEGVVFNGAAESIRTDDEGRAVFADETAVRASWRRPKWDIVQKQASQAWAPPGTATKPTGSTPKRAQVSAHRSATGTSKRSSGSKGACSQLPRVSS